MKITLWGTRGTVPTPPLPGSSLSSLGGNTPCVAVDVDGCEPLILDGGTGLHWLGDALLSGDFARGCGLAHLLLTHTHWDHIQGIPFFPPLIVPGNRFTFYGCGSGGRSLAALLDDQMDTVYCPVPNPFSCAVGAHVEVREIGEESFQIGPVQLTARRVNHRPDAACLGYRLQHGNAVMAYLPDVEYLEEKHRHPALGLARDADLLIHDAHFTSAEYAHRRGQGHCSDGDAADLARDAGARHLLLFHHHPDRKDASGYATARTVGNPIVEAACEGARYVIADDGARRIS